MRLRSLLQQQQSGARLQDDNSAPGSSSWAMTRWPALHPTERYDYILAMDGRLRLSPRAQRLSGDRKDLVNV